jgi:hypothetical protein
VVVTGGQDVGALQRLLKVAEDVEYGHDAVGGVVRAGDICNASARERRVQGEEAGAAHRS